MNELKIDNLLKNAALTTTIEERIHLLKKLSSYDDQLDALHSWRKRKTLVNDESFMIKLNLEKLTEQEFNLGIKELEPKEMDYISEWVVNNAEWYKNFIKIINYYKNHEHSTKAGSILDFSFALRTFLIWAKNQLDRIILQSNNITLSNEALGMLMEGFFQDLVSIAEKTLVYDMHSMKNKVSFDGATPQERYKFFLKTRFTTLESMMEFFNDYPTLTKLLTIRTIFFIDYIKEFVNNSDDNMNIIRGLFDYRGEGCITSVKVGAGDSHEKGKAVILFELDNSLKLVYKPKNLKIAREYYNFLNWISSQDPKFEFFIPKQIYGETFMIEGFLFHKDCKNKEEVQEFYRSFGHLIGIAHFLCGTDFHYENLIAHGKFPVLIDVETLFQHTPAINLGSDAYVKSKFDNLESVLFTGLVPFIAYTDKSEDGNSGIQLSALSGDTQKMPYKILKISNMNTDEMAFDYQEHIIDGSQNLPKVNGTKIDFRDYIPNIIKGFEEICTFFFENKKNLIGEEGIIHKFAGIKVRNVLKGTQRYGDMLNFSYHPSCTQNFIEREKLFENSWAYPYYQKEVVIHEVRDLCIGDIPVFYNKVDSKDLITSDGTIVENFHDYPPLMKSIQRIKQLDSQEIEKQTSHLMVSLGMYNQESHLLNKKQKSPAIGYKNKIDKDLFLSESLDIADCLLDEVTISDDEQTVSWNDVVLENSGSWAINPINGDLYDGLSGILLYYAKLHKITKADKYKYFYQKIEHSVYRRVINDSDISSFSGRGSLLYPLTALYMDTGENSYEEKISGVTKFIMERIDNINNDDWLSGYAGILKNLVNLYKITEKAEYKKAAEEIGNRINIERIKLGGFAHGYAGVSSSLFALSEISKKNNIYYSKAIQALERDRELFHIDKGGWLDKRKQGEVVSHKWCHGTAGIGLNRIKNYDLIENKILLNEELSLCYNKIMNQLKKDDCLCHGNFGDIEFLLEYYMLTKDGKVYDEIINKLNRILSVKEEYGGYLVRSIPQFRGIGLFTGLSGIGYEYLRLYDPLQVPSVLHLDINK